MLDMLGRMGVMALGTMLTALLPLITAVAYFVRPSERRLVLMRPLSLAAAFAAISGLRQGRRSSCGGSRRPVASSRTPGPC